MGDRGTGPDGRHPQASALNALSGIARMLPGASQVTAAARAWWPGSHAQVLDAASSLRACATPAGLEEAVCDLLGGHWRRMLGEQGTGLLPQEWLEGLLEAATPRAGESAVRRLLLGIAVIAPLRPAGVALDLLAKVGTSSIAGEEPAWLDVPPTVTASPEVLLLRDVYGLRFGLLAQVSGPDAQPRSYLFDVDLCHGFYQVLASGYHPDVTAAAAAWRALVGVSAAGAQPAPVPADLLPHVLPGGGLISEIFGRPLTDDHFRELYRGDRSLADRFRAWAARHRVDLPPAGGPDEDVVVWMLHDWVAPGTSEQLCLACSPHRIAAFTAYLNDDWRPHDRSRALAVLRPWARYCLERSGVTGTAAEHTLAWAARAARAPEAVGSDLGNNLNRPLDETTVTGPPLPHHAR